MKEMIQTTAIKVMDIAATQERERIITNINSRVLDLRACTKNDNCQELSMLIESYIPEWTDPK